MNILRGDMFFANLDPVLGCEQGGYRPILIIQNNTGNIYSPTVIVASITSQTNSKSKLPTHILLNRIPQLEKTSIVLLEQLRTIDKMRLEYYIGHLDKFVMNQIDHALSISLGLSHCTSQDT